MEDLQIDELHEVDQKVALKRLRAQLTAVQKGELKIVCMNVEVPVVEITDTPDEYRKYATTGLQTWTFVTEPAAGQNRFRKQ